MSAIPNSSNSRGLGAVETLDNHQIDRARLHFASAAAPRNFTPHLAKGIALAAT
jgi:hypothetical protein